MLLAALTSAATVSIAQDPQPATTSAPTTAPAVYDTTADAKQQIAAAVAKARRENQRVLIMWGGNWCSWCRKLHQMFTTDETVARLVLYEYQLVPVDIGKFDKHLDVAAGYGITELKKNGVPFLTVLDGDGKVLVNQESGSLEAGPKHDPAKVTAFLNKYRAPRQDAQKVLAAAKAEAGRGEKAVLVHFGAPWCPWCRRLDDFLARPEIADILARDYVDLKIDVDRMDNGRDVQFEVRGPDKGGLPWMVILDSKGKRLANSDGPKGNIGFPAQSEEIAHFIGMLKKTARRIGAEDLAKIERALTTEGEKIKAQRAKP